MYSFNIDFNRLSISKLVDIIMEFGITKSGTSYIAPKGDFLIKLTKDKNLLDLSIQLNNEYMCANNSIFEEDNIIQFYIKV